jgi:hypothetical protein
MAIHHISGINIRTNYDYPPIPVRQFDWSAIDDDTYDGADDSSCPIGHGATEFDAIEDLLEQIDDEKISANSQFGMGA